ncbi:MAG: PHB depolymerase family esterase [Bacteroidales bacterium]|nr:PHB depolymerase family esterase [Bacteroidales bacterium]
MKKPFIILIFFSLLACNKDKPVFLLEVNVTVGFNKANLYWDKVFDKSELVLYQFYSGDQLIWEGENTYHYEFTDLEENTSYAGLIKASNNSGVLLASGQFNFTTTKNQPPSIFTISINKISSTQVDFEWTRAVDFDEGVATYSVILDDKILADHTDNRAYSISGLEPETNYKIRVIASDNQGNKTEVPISVNTLKKGAEISQNFAQFIGIKREYCLYKPSNAPGSRLPLVIYLHGWSNIIWPGMITDYFPALAEEENFMLLMPQAKAAMGGQTAWDSHNIHNWDDASFINELIDLMVSDYQVNDQQVYITGFSNGGFMTFYLSQVLEDRLAAVAPIAGLMDLSNFAKYSLKKPMPLCYIHGTADSVVKVGGDVNHVSFDKILDYFIQKNGVDPTPLVTQLPDTYIYDNSTVTKIEYTTLSSSADIIYYRINSCGHSIPGRSWSNRDIHAFDVIWDFFKTRKLSDK